LLVSSFLIAIGVAFMVVDISRSMIYHFLGAIVCLYILTKSENPTYIRNLVNVLGAVCILVPTYFAQGGFRIEGANPLVFKVLDRLRT